MRWVSLAFSFVLVLGVFGTLAVLQPESFSGYATEPTEDSLSIRTQTLVTAMTVASSSASVLAAIPAASSLLDHDHSDHSDHEDDDSTPAKNAAADFASLPQAQQSEIIQLSGRSGDEGKSYQVVEVKPGVVAVMANNGPQVVPVAVLNEDGTVSIHEY